MHGLEPALLRATGLEPCEGVFARCLSAGLDEEAIYLLSWVIDTTGGFHKRSYTHSSMTQFLYLELRAKTSLRTQHSLPSSPVNQALAGREFSSLAFIFAFPGWIKNT